MPSDSLIHDHAMALALAILQKVAPCLREEEQREALQLFYDTCRASLIRYEQKAARFHRRINPSRN
jgi:hypothetical protein